MKRRLAKGTIKRPPGYIGRFIFVRRVKPKQAIETGSYPIEVNEPKTKPHQKPTPYDIANNIRKRQFTDTKRGLQKVAKFRQN